MPSTPTTRNRLEKQAAGENSNTWGAPKLNTVIDLLDASLDGLTTKALTGNYSLTSTNYADDESRKRVLRFTGTGTFTVTIPGVEKWYIVDNQCTGDLTITTGSGTTGVVQPGVMTVVTCDGTNVKALPPQSMVSSTALNVGTSTANDVQFVTNNATRYRIGSTGLHYFNGSTASGQLNVRAASGVSAIVLDNPSGTETLSFTSRLSAGFATGYAANATFSIGTTTANTLQFVTNNVIHYTISAAGIHQINGSGNSGVFNVRSASGEAAIMGDNPSGSERIYMYSRVVPGLSMLSSQNSTLRIQTDNAYAVQLAANGVVRYTIDSNGIHYVNGGEPIGVQNILHSSGGYALSIQNTSNVERLNLTSRISAGVASVVSDNALLRIVSTTGGVEFWPANTYAGGISDSGLNVTFTGVANSGIGVYANVYVNPSTGRLSQVVSSRRYKKDITEYIPGGSIDDIAPKFYRLKSDDSGPLHPGVIAEEMHDAGFTEFVIYNADGEPNSVNYPGMVTLLVHELKQLRARVTALEAR